MNILRNWIKECKLSLFHLWISIIVLKARKKQVIRFLFILSELTQWKTESLYLAMLKNPRLEPILGITPSRGYPGAENTLIEYCRERGYNLIRLDSEKTISSQIQVDFVMHQKPYKNEIHPAHYINRNKSIPVVVIQYYLSTITEDWVVNQHINRFAWRQFIDNDSCKDDWIRIHRFHGRNYRVTGLPVVDELLTPKDHLPDVWPVHDGRKRIIYAPHHTIADMHWSGIGYSTFLDYYEAMLTVRDKYIDKVYFVFKPHPALWNRLVVCWGEEKTRAYYSQWDKSGISHVEQGKYLSLFKHSDAMIHDCASFTIEYMYMDNPVMYLVRDESHADNMIPYAREAFDLHYKGRSISDVEQFIENVISGNDPLKEQRERFKESRLLPSNGKTACENIIDSILGND